MKIMIVAHNRLFREVLVALLSAVGGLDIVAQAGPDMAAVRLATRTRPDVVVVDQGTGDLAQETLPALRQAAPRTSIVLLTTRASPPRPTPAPLADVVVAADAGKEDLLALIRHLAA
jgi:DNA-binding NarL/FixJ family response regulator